MNMPAPLRLFRLLFVACLLSRFKPVTEDKVAMEGNEGTAETKFNVTSSKPSLTSATAVVVVVTETQYANTHFLIAAIIWVCHSESIYTQYANEDVMQYVCAILIMRIYVHTVPVKRSAYFTDMFVCAPVVLSCTHKVRVRSL